MNKVIISRYESAAGALIIGSREDKICLCDWYIESRRCTIGRRVCRYLGAEIVEGLSPAISMAMVQMDEYFRGERKEFDIPIEFAGTDFQIMVWTELMKIPYGSTASYSQIAQHIGNPKAIRAVATAIASNALSIFVPCHRVIGSDGSLTGYAGGLRAKQFLLAHEQKTCKATLF